MRSAVTSVTGREQEASAKWSDPFGVRAGLSRQHSMSMLTWRDYAAKFKTVAASTVREGRSWAGARFVCPVSGDELPSLLCQVSWT